MLEQMKTLGAVGMEWMYFECEEDMNFVGPGAECYRLNVYILPKFRCWNPIPKVVVLGAGALGGD